MSITLRRRRRTYLPFGVCNLHVTQNLCPVYSSLWMDEWMNERTEWRTDARITDWWNFLHVQFKWEPELLSEWWIWHWKDEEEELTSSRVRVFSHTTSACYTESLHCLKMGYHGKGAREQHYLSVRPTVLVSVVRPFVCHTIFSKTTGRNQTCYITSAHGKVVREQHYFSVRPSIHPCYSPLSHWAEFNQTCYTTSAHGKVVREQHYFSMRPSIRPCYGLLSHWAEFNQTCYITSAHGKVVREQHYFSVRPSIRPCYSLLSHWAEFNQTCYMTSRHGKGVGEQLRTSVRHAISNISKEHEDLLWRAIDFALCLYILKRVGW